MILGAILGIVFAASSVHLALNIGLTVSASIPIAVLAVAFFRTLGKSTILEGIASFAGYDDAGGGKGYAPVDHSHALEVMGGSLAGALVIVWTR